MLKKLLILAFAGLLSPAFAAGTVPGFSLAQQQDSNGTPLIGCKLYVIQAGTVATPQNAYQDSGLTIPLPNPVICDAYGRLPQIFLADGTIKLRLTKSNGTQVFAADGILVVGASSGGGGGSPVDPTTVIATGDIKVRYGTGVLAGFVRANGRTIGSSTSGATERANADCQVLFQYLWDTDVNLAVSGGRGVSSLADWTANKTIVLPDGRSRSLAGLGDMGSTDNALFSGVTFTSGNSTTLGSLLGAARRSLLAANIPSITSTNAAQSITVGNAAQHIPFANANWAQTGTFATTGFTTGAFTGGSVGDLTTITGSNSISVTSTGTTGSAFDAVSTLLLTTIYIKL